MSRDMIVIQALSGLGLPKRAILDKLSDQGVPYAPSLGTSGWLAPDGYTMPSSIVYPTDKTKAPQVATMLYAISSMTFAHYSKKIMVIDLDMLVRQLYEGYTARASYLDDSEYGFNELGGLAVLNFVTDTSDANTYTERERNRVRGLLLHMIKCGKGVHLGVTSSDPNAIANEWGANFKSSLDTLGVTPLRLPLTTGRKR